MNLVRFLSSWSLLVFLALLCAGCGTTSTDYSFSSHSTAQQKREILRAVDSTAHLLKLTRQTGSSFEDDEAFFHTYLRGSLILDTFLISSLTIQTFGDAGRVSVSLSTDGRTKSPDFIRAEKLLTPALLHIDPHLTIKTGYTQNPMM
jgi:hypothetical protein